MSGLRLRLTSAPAGRFDLSCLTPAGLAGQTANDVSRLPYAGATLGDFFAASDTGEDGTLVLEGVTAACDSIGADMTGGTLIVEGDVGAYAGRHMRNGHLEIRGNAGDWLAAGLKGGLVTVTGSAGDYLGGMLAGEKFGMAGGTVHVGGSIGQRAGDRMRRGTIVVKGRTGAAAGSRMAGGTIWAEGGIGPGAGNLMRRGTLIAPSADNMLPTFSDCGHHDMVFLRLMSRHAADVLGALAPQALPPKVRRYAGDMATIGKGEILLTS